MDLDEIKELGSRYLFGNYGRTDLAFTHGSGCCLYGTDGREYLDLVAGIAVNVLGYCHPAWTEAVKAQVSTLVHVSNLYHCEEQARLGEKLASVMPGDLDRSLFVNSGAEANEGALKLAVRYTGRGKVLSALNGFHGRTSASLGATGREVYRESFEPLISGAFGYFRFGDPESVKGMVDSDTAAVVVEPIQGEGGVVTASSEFFRTVRDECTDKGALMIADEVQTGMGRTGEWFGIQHHGVVPDIVTTAKALGGGVPVGAVTSTAEISSVMVPGTHGTTFGGNPLVCAAGCAVIDTMRREHLVENSRDLGRRWMSDLRSVVSDRIRGVRGSGLMIGIETDTPETAEAVRRHCMDNGVLVNVCHGSVVRLVPPLILEDGQKDIFTDLLKECVL